MTFASNLSFFSIWWAININWPPLLIVEMRYISRPNFSCIHVGVEFMSPCENIFDRMHALTITLNTCHYISIIFLPGNGYSRHYKKVWGINLTCDKPKTDWIEYRQSGTRLTCWGGRVGRQSSFLSHKSEVNGTKFAGVSYYIYSFA